MNDCVGCASSEIENRSGNSAYAELLVHDAFQRCAFRHGREEKQDFALRERFKHSHLVSGNSQ
jgi:hypothetical protein